jgi:Mu-like prophage protein gp36
VYLDRDGLLARVEIDFLVGATIGGFSDHVPTSDFSAAVLVPIADAADKAFVQALYSEDQGMMILRELSGPEKKRYFTIHCAAQAVTRVEDAIADACAEIDGYLVGRYTLPLDPVPAVLAKFCADLAAYAILGTRRLDEEKDKDFVRRAEAARDYLTKVAEGKITLTAPTVSGHEAATIQFRARPRLDLRGY